MRLRSLRAKRNWNPMARSNPAPDGRDGSGYYLNDAECKKAQGAGARGGGMKSESDVMIIGAGPTGLVLALLLARRGLDVAVYEKWTAHYPLPRAVALSHESLRILQATGHFSSLMPSIDVELSRRLKPEYFSVSGETLFSHPVQNDGFSFYPPMIIFDQPYARSGAQRGVCEGTTHQCLSRMECALNSSG